MKGWKIVVGSIAVVAIGGTILAWLLFGPSRSMRQPPPRPGAATKTVTQSPTEVVVSYLEALQNKDYQTAYSYLSRESKRKHPSTEFASLNETKGITEYDLSTAREAQGEDGYMTVAVQLREDPASAGFRMVKEGGSWKIVFLGGIPSYPYP